MENGRSLKSLVLFILLIFFMTGCYISFGEIDEIDIPYWMQGAWSVFLDDNQPHDDISLFVIDGNSIVIKSNTHGEHDLVAEVRNNGGFDTEYEKSYELNFYSGPNLIRYVFTFVDNSIIHFYTSDDNYLILRENERL